MEDFLDHTVGGEKMHHKHEPFYVLGQRTEYKEKMAHLCLFTMDATILSQAR